MTNYCISRLCKHSLGVYNWLREGVSSLTKKKGINFTKILRPKSYRYCFNTWKKERQKKIFKALKTLRLEAETMAQQLKAIAALLKDPRLDPCTLTRWLITTYNSSFKKPNALASAGTCTHIALAHTDINTHSHKIRINLLKNKNLSNSQNQRIIIWKQEAQQAFLTSRHKMAEGKALETISP